VKDKFYISFERMEAYTIFKVIYLQVEEFIAKSFRMNEMN